MSQFLHEFWPHITITSVVVAILEGIAVCHAVLFKRDTRATIGWVGLILLTPLIGAILYWVFGINRIHRKAQLMRCGEASAEPRGPEFNASPELIEETLGHENRHFRRLMELVRNATGKSLVQGNEIEPLIDGDEAYPAMLRAIDGAQKSISLASYIFDNDRVGKLFAHALTEAKGRGVEVRVLVDDIGKRYSFPSIVRMLHKAGVNVATFMPSLAPGYFAYFNLRSHRKILVVDGKIGFTGGMNIREGCWLNENPRKLPTADVHFRLEGPIVAQLQEVFAEDWAFTTGEVLRGPLWYAEQASVGHMLARGIAYGPDESRGIVGFTLIGAIGVAQRKVTIVTPYFLPDEPLVSALNVAALRGVEVNIVLPERGNLTTVQWATHAMLWQILEYGCKVWLTPAPFDHTKLMVVDGIWTLIGSGNWDPRSLRLNFEFNVEIYNAEFAARADAAIDAKRRKARELTLAEIDARRLPVRLRDGLARLMSPYL
jgi:cardiolipin synthase A/B